MVLLQELRRRYEGKLGKWLTGTLFLDEIGEMPLEIQDSCRFLQDKSITRIGNKTQKVDVRIIAATNRDLRQELKIIDFEKIYILG